MTLRETLAMSVAGREPTLGYWPLRSRYRRQKLKNILRVRRFWEHGKIMTVRVRITEQGCGQGIAGD